MFRWKRFDSWRDEPKTKKVVAVLGIEPKDLVPLGTLCESRELPLTLKQAKAACLGRRCYGHMLPAFKIGREWYSTRRAVKVWLFTSANPAMREFVLNEAEKAGDLENADYTLPGPAPFERHRRYSLKIFCGTPFLPIPYETARKYCSGKLKPRLRNERIGKHWMVSRVDTSRWLADCRNNAVGYASGRKGAELNFEFSPLGLVRVKELCEKGVIPMLYRNTIRHCLNFNLKSAKKPALPAWKIAGEWWTTHHMLGIWFVRQGNSAAKRFCEGYSSASSD